METTNINTIFIENYLGLIRNLSPEIKLDIIEKISNTLKGDFKKKKNSINESFGAWSSTKTADEIIDELRDNRNFNREIEPL